MPDTTCAATRDGVQRHVLRVLDIRETERRRPSRARRPPPPACACAIRRPTTGARARCRRCCRAMPPATGGTRFQLTDHAKSPCFAYGLPDEARPARPPPESSCPRPPVANLGNRRVVFLCVLAILWFLIYGTQNYKARPRFACFIRSARSIVEPFRLHDPEHCLETHMMKRHGCWPPHCWRRWRQPRSRVGRRRLQEGDARRCRLERYRRYHRGRDDAARRAEATKTIASPPIVLAGVKKAIDAFLGYWDPSMTPTVKPFVDAGAVHQLPQPNLIGARYAGRAAIRV